MVKFPKIKQFRDIIREVRASAQFQGVDKDGNPIMDRDAILPKINYIGTVKMHGTNSSVRLTEDKKIIAQSRNRIITPDDDNAGFAKFVFNKTGQDFWVQKIWDDVFVKFVMNEPNAEGIINDIPKGQREITVYGEWCGGNIQSGIALSSLEKMFVIFAVKIGKEDQSCWLDRQYIERFNYPEQNIYNVFQFEHYTTSIDFENPSLSQNELIEITNAVENRCPVGFHFGSEGTGEGVVWRPDPVIHPDFNRSKFWFKVKGEKHSDSKVKTLAPIDPEKAKSINEFITMATTEHRLQKGIDFLVENNLELSKKSTGKFLQWLGNDILEEESDTMEASNLERKDVMKSVSEEGKRWFFAYLDAQEGL